MSGTGRGERAGSCEMKGKLAVACELGRDAEQNIDDNKQHLNIFRIIDTLPKLLITLRDDGVTSGPTWSLELPCPSPDVF